MKKYLFILLSLASYISNAQIISTFAGNGMAGYTGDGVAATSTEIYNAYGVWVDNIGNVYIADALNNRIRKVSPSGVITTIAGTGTTGFSGDGGPATAAKLNFPVSVAVDPAGNVYINDMQNNRIREIKPAADGGGGGDIYTIAGTGTPGFSGDGGQATNAMIYSPQGIFLDASGNLFFGDELNHRIRKISSTGIITTIAGDGIPGYSGDGMQATASGLYNPSGVVTDAVGNVYIADYYDSRIRKINTSGIISTIAGNGVIGYGGDGGPATLAQLRYPKDIFLDGSGNLYISDADNQLIREVNAATGVITTIAGTGTGTFGGDGGPATNAQLYEPQGLFIDASNNIYIGDCLNNRVRYIHSVTTNTSPLYSTENIDIYPNPSSNQFTVESTSQPINQIIITSIMGQTIFSHNYNAQQVQINITDLPDGMYIVKINNLVTKRLIKQ